MSTTKTNANEYSIEKLIYTTFGMKCLITQEYRAYLKEWAAWYSGKVKDFHEIGKRGGYVDEIAQINFAKTIAESKADLIFNEKVKINIPKNRQKEWNRIMNYNNFWTMANRSVEIANALGTFAWVVYESGKDVVIDYIQPQMIFPLSFTNDEITECVFASVFTKQGKEYLYLNAHILNDSGRYVITNKYFNWSSDTNMPAAEVPADFFGVAPEIVSGVIPRFFIIKPNVENNIIKNCPMGVSRYANSINLLKTLDIIYDSLHKEFILGRKRILVGAETLGFDGKDPIPKFNLRERIFNVFTVSGDDTLIKEIDMKLRTGEHEDALRMVLNLISLKTGFGVDYFSWDKNGGIKTATEVISENSDLFRSIRKDEILLERALLDLIAAIFEIKGWAVDADDIEIEWDDSIIQDEDARLNRLLTEVNSQIRTPVSYLMEAYNMTEEEARAIVPENEIAAFNREMELLRNGGGEEGGEDENKTPAPSAA